jgi:hypothetical protein
MIINNAKFDVWYIASILDDYFNQVKTAVYCDSVSGDVYCIESSKSPRGFIFYILGDRKVCYINLIFTNYEEFRTQYIKLVGFRVCPTEQEFNLMLAKLI